jgi:hypothetical protein
MVMSICPPAVWQLQCIGDNVRAKSGAHMTQAPRPSCSAASSRFCAAMAALCTAMRYLGLAPSFVGIFIHVAIVDANDDDRWGFGNSCERACDVGLNQLRVIPIGGAIVTQTLAHGFRQLGFHRLIVDGCEAPWLPIVGGRGPHCRKQQPFDHRAADRTRLIPAYRPTLADKTSEFCFSCH